MYRITKVSIIGSRMSFLLIVRRKANILENIGECSWEMGLFENYDFARMKKRLLDIFNSFMSFQLKQMTKDLRSDKHFQA